MDARNPRSMAWLALVLAFAVLACAGFVALGVWQVNRLAWKEALIAQVDRQLRATPTDVPKPPAWPALRREQDEYRRLHAQGRFDFHREVLVRASTELGAGYWVLTPMQLAGGEWLLVNRGFVPPDLRDQVPHGDALQTVIGLLRFSEPGGSLLQKNEPTQGRWYSRDVAAIAAAQHLTGQVAPFFIDAQVGAGAGPGASGDWPRAGLTVIHFTNNHLAYALTWFALAVIMAAAIGYLMAHERRLRGRPGASFGERP
jgi:surfeit locus 1 family protein